MSEVSKLSPLNDAINEFAFTRQRNEMFDKFYEKQKSKIGHVIFRGLPLHKTEIFKGNIIKEWYGSSHWSLDFNTALRFSHLSKSNDDYLEHKGYQLKDMRSVVMILEDEYKIGLRLYEFLKPIEAEFEKIHGSMAWGKVSREKEITILDKDFKIVEIVENSDNLIIVKVKSIDKKQA